LLSRLASVNRHNLQDAIARAWMSAQTDLHLQSCSAQACSAQAKRPFGQVFMTRDIPAITRGDTVAIRLWLFSLGCAGVRWWETENETGAVGRCAGDGD